MNTRCQRNSVGGIGCESIENQDPEAVHEGDLYVHRKRGTVCDMRGLSGDAKGRRCASHGKGRGGQNGKRPCIIVSIQTSVERQSESNRAWDCCASPNQTGKGHIEPREGAEEAEENLGLDDIPRVRMVEWILLAACEERIRGRSLMKAEREGQGR
jgi:hypothetical protein